MVSCVSEQVMQKNYGVLLGISHDLPYLSPMLLLFVMYNTRSWCHFRHGAFISMLFFTLILFCLIDYISIKLDFQVNIRVALLNEKLNFLLVFVMNGFIWF